jgi:hypothetical protein
VSENDDDKKKAEPADAQEAKGEEVKAAEAKAEDKKAEEAKAEDKKAEEAKAEDKKAEDKKAEEAKAEDKKAEDAKAEDKKTQAKTEAKKSEDKPAAAKPAAKPQKPDKSAPKAKASADDGDAKQTQPDAWDLAGDWLAKNGALPALAVLTIAIGIIHGHVFWGEPVGDDLTFHFAESARLADCLRVGDFDFWNPSANAGYASAYYYQVLPQLASALPAAIFGHHLFWFEFSVWLPHVIAPAAAYKGLRLVGATPWQSVVGAFAVAFMNGESRWGTGNAGTFQVGLYTQTWALAVYPLALGYGARWIRDSKGLAPAIAWSVFVALCHPFAGGVLGIGLAVSLVAGLVPRLAPVHWPSIAGRALIMFGVAELFLFPPEWARLGFVMDRFGLEALPDTFAYVVGYGAIIAGLVLPIVVRREGVSWRFHTLFGDRTARVPVYADEGFTGEAIRIAILGLCIVIGALPFWLPFFGDYNGFGGFPHRVWDEVGPGFSGLALWYRKGAILDFANPDQINRLAVLTWSVPAVLLVCRSRMMRWFWPCALFFAALLAIGPHMGKIGDDLFPPVRALGAMQIVLALAVGSGAMIVGRMAWDAPAGSDVFKISRVTIIAAASILAIVVLYSIWYWSWVFRLATALHLPFESPLVIRTVVTVLVLALIVLNGLGVIPLWKALGTQYGLRTALSAIAAALAVLVAVPGARALGMRVVVLEDYPNNNRSEMMTINETLAKLPPGRKQTGPGAENHWWNLLSYAYDRVPSTLQMGGGGLQASPNYDFLWWTQTQLHDFQKTAWVYDAPYVVFLKSLSNKAPGGETLLRTEHYEIRRINAPGLVSPVHVVGYLAPAQKLDTERKAFVHMYVDTVGVLPPGYHNLQIGHEAALEWLKGDQPMKDEVVAYTGSGTAGSEPDGKLLRAWHQDSPGDEPDIVAEVEATKTTTFMIRESWHPRWRAYLDGEPVPIRRLTPDFPAIDVPPGTHTISLRFERPWWALASWLAWPGISVLAWLWTRRRKKAAA